MLSDICVSFEKEWLVGIHSLSNCIFCYPLYRSSFSWYFFLVGFKTSAFFSTCAHTDQGRRNVFRKAEDWSFRYATFSFLCPPPSPPYYWLTFLSLTFFCFPAYLLSCHECWPNSPNHMAWPLYLRTMAITNRPLLLCIFTSWIRQKWSRQIGPKCLIERVQTRL